MMSSRIFIAVLGLAVTPLIAQANARLISVVPASGGCVSGPAGPAVQAWDVEPGQTYTLTIADVPDCSPQLNSKRKPAFDGAPTINVRVNSTGSGNTDLVASYVGPGTYAFDFTVPPGATCTMPIFYCTTPGDGSSGTFVTRDDGGSYQAHLRAATFLPGCTYPQEIPGPACGPVPVDASSWGHVKALYR